jgi:hypothetical protein
MNAFFIPLALVRHIGVMEAFFLCYLICKIDSPPAYNNLISVEEVANETGINEYAQRKLLAELSKRGYLSVAREGNAPPKRRIDILRVPKELIKHLSVY